MYNISKPNINPIGIVVFVNNNLNLTSLKKNFFSNPKPYQSCLVFNTNPKPYQSCSIFSIVTPNPISLVQFFNSNPKPYQSCINFQHQTQTLSVLWIFLFLFNRQSEIFTVSHMFLHTILSHVEVLLSTSIQILTLIKPL